MRLIAVSVNTTEVAAHKLLEAKIRGCVQNWAKKIVYAL